MGPLGVGLLRVNEESEGDSRRGVEASVQGRALRRPTKERQHRIRGWGPRLIFQSLSQPLRGGIGIGIEIEIVVGIESGIVIGMGGEIEVVIGLNGRSSDWGPLQSFSRHRGCKLAFRAKVAQPRTDLECG